MRLSRIQITNYARIPDVDLNLGKQVVLVGPNDVGKTCILRCLHFALGASLASLHQNISAKDVRDPSEAMKISVDLVEFSDEERSVLPDEISVSTAGEEVLTILLEVEVFPGDEAELSIRRSFPASGHHRPPTRSQLAAVGWQYLPAVRSGGAEGVEGRASALRALLGSVDFGAEKAAISDAIDDLNSTLRASSTLADLRAAMASHLSLATYREVIPDNLSFRTASTPDDMLRLLGLFLDRDGTIRPIAEQSDGFNALAAIAFYDLSASGSNIVAIDEPETHLHPAAQRALAELLAAGTNQKIISTHSPFIVQRFDPEDVVAFSADRRSRQLPRGALNKTDKVLAQWWIASRLEPLTARRVLFVEGSADRILIEACVGAAGISLDKLGVSVVELGGAASFRQAHRMFGAEGFNIDVIGLVDEDHEEAWASDLGVPVAELNQHGIFVSRKDLEAEYVLALGEEGARNALVDSGAFTLPHILKSCDVSAEADLTISLVTSFCGKSRNKVQAALAASTVLTADHIDKMDGVKGLVNKLRSFS
ncbi:AAA family ATPase [Micromonospora chersina]|uniref:ATP-dependent nuclease n=1 Tax=Micromonospora chersina TaxID=47854 RepID=UPI0034103678